MQTRTFEALVNACPEDVWSALTDPERTRQYFYGLAVHSDWQIGSHIVYSGPPPHKICGEVVLVERPRLLMHTLADGQTMLGDLDPVAWVTWTIDSADSGQSKVCVVVEDLERVDDAEFDEAWRLVLEQLARYLEDARKPNDIAEG
jgi:uncharacterized protein YndB with AHSA1/START domain